MNPISPDPGNGQPKDPKSEASAIFMQGLYPSKDTKSLTLYLKHKRFERELYESVKKGLKKSLEDPLILSHLQMSRLVEIFTRCTHGKILQELIAKSSLEKVFFFTEVDITAVHNSNSLYAIENHQDQILEINDNLIKVEVDACGIVMAAERMFEAFNKEYPANKFNQDSSRESWEFKIGFFAKYFDSILSKAAIFRFQGSNKFIQFNKLIEEITNKPNLACTYDEWQLLIEEADELFGNKKDLDDFEEVRSGIKESFEKKHPSSPCEREPVNYFSELPWYEVLRSGGAYDAYNKYHAQKRLEEEPIEREIALAFLYDMRSDLLFIVPEEAIVKAILFCAKRHARALSRYEVLKSMSAAKILLDGESFTIDQQLYFATVLEKHQEFLSEFLLSAINNS